MTSVEQLRTLRWQGISTASTDSGIYAWYYEPTLAEFDLDRLDACLSAALDASARAKVVQQFLEEQLYKLYRETPYEVRVSGPLKARYEGDIAHIEAVSPSLVARLESDPQRVRLIARILPLLAPQFSSPLYIGMATSLRKRLSQHKKLIQMTLERNLVPEALDELTMRDHSFAAEVVQRGFDPSSLFVNTLILPGQANVALDVENLLNRINYPVMGRN